jgi:putative transcriptional regulator
MQIVVNLDMMLVRRKMSLTELSQKVGVTIANLSILKSGKARGVRFETLKKICEALECKPGDILDIISDEEYKKLYRISDADWPISNDDPDL